jgi:leucyl aminopeptidase
MLFATEKINHASESDIFVIPLYVDQSLPSELETFDRQLDGLLQHVLKQNEYEPKANSTYIVHTHRKIFSPKIMLVGLGKKHELTPRSYQLAIASAAHQLKNRTTQSATFYIPAYLKLDLDTIARLTVQAIIYGSYTFEPYKSPEPEQKSTRKQVDMIVLLSDEHIDKKAIDEGAAIGTAVNMVRDLGNHPANVATPTMLAERALAIAKETNLEVEILDRSDMQALHLNAMLAVARGSHEPPKFIILKHQHSDATKTIALVGKGVTFDSGGISLKPTNLMDNMKFDMAGGAAVLGVMHLVGQENIPLNVIGLIPATENLPGGMASKPGDVIRAYNGKTIEILNTDAEGRLIVADAMAYAEKKFHPQIMIDVATLTGACLIALGNEAAGLMGNNAKLNQALEHAAEQSGERLWQFPFWDEYKELIKSHIADVANAGTKTGSASSIAGGIFLSNFVQHAAWAHLDIAGTAWVDTPQTYAPKGATGYGVRLLWSYVRSLVIPHTLGPVTPRKRTGRPRRSISKKVTKDQTLTFS